MIWLMGRSNREYHPRETSPGGESGLHSVSAFVTVSIKTSSPTARGGVSPATLVRTAVLVPLTASEARLVGCVNLTNRVPMTIRAAFWAAATSAAATQVVAVPMVTPVVTDEAIAAVLSAPQML